MHTEELTTEFQSESKELVGQLVEILESIEGDYSQFKRLQDYGQMVDRIMGAAKSLALVVREHKETLNVIGKYAELCKQVSYKGSRVSDNENLFNVVVALLLDATEMLSDMIGQLSTDASIDIKNFLTTTFLDRLRWVSKHFAPELKGSLNSGAGTDADIDGILRSMGLIP